MRSYKYIATMALVVLVFTSCATAPQSAETAPRQVKNIIFLLSDGTANEAWPMVRWVAGGKLASDEILSGAIRTYGADSIITDSAPGATSYATGYKGTDKGIAVYPWNVTIAGVENNEVMKYVPLATVLEGARLSGRATGVVATANVQHATPASFSSHCHDRSNYNEIGEQQVYQNIEVVLSGGEQYFLPKGVGKGQRTDNENLVDVVEGKGYTYIKTRDELIAAKGEKLFGMFADETMAYDMDRAQFAPTQPSLAEMVKKAVDTLAAGKKGKDKGFFLFVEGSKVDWAAHANDATGVYSDLKAYDDAVKVALDFAKADGNTLLISVSDHATGGLSIGIREDANYSQTDDDYLVGPMRQVKATAEAITPLIAKDPSEANIRAVYAKYWGVTDLSAEEIGEIQKKTSDAFTLYRSLGLYQSKRAKIGWTSNGHTGGDVFMYSYGPKRPTGIWENKDIGIHMASMLGFNFTDLNKRLFVEASAGFQTAGCTVALDKTDAENPILVVTKGSASAKLPLAKNLLLVNGKTIELEGIVIQVEKIEKVFVPQQAIDLMKAELK